MKIFNFHQANFLFKNGCEIINMGYGQKDGKPYVKFVSNSLFEDNAEYGYGMFLAQNALRNALNPMITLLGFEFAGLLSGAALTEYVFQYPGLGRLILEAVMKSDINLVMASLMMGSIMLVLGNLIADILLIITDPRIRN